MTIFVTTFVLDNILESHGVFRDFFEFLACFFC